MIEFISPSLRTGRADLPHPALRLVVYLCRIDLATWWYCGAQRQHLPLKTSAVDLQCPFGCQHIARNCDRYGPAFADTHCRISLAALSSAALPRPQHMLHPPFWTPLLRFRYELSSLIRVL